MRKLIITLSLLAVSAVVTNAAALLTEPFTYANGSLVGATGSPWTTSSGAIPGEQNVVSGELFLNDNETEDTRASLSSEMTSGIITATLLLRVDSADVPTSTAGDYIAHFIGDTNSMGISGDQIGRIWTRKPNVAATGAFSLGVSNSGTSAIFFATDFAAGTNYTLTLSYNFTTATSTLSVTGVGSVIATDTAAAITRIDAFGFRQTSATGDQFIDNLGIVPEPSTYMMMLGGIGILGVASRRKSRMNY